MSNIENEIVNCREYLMKALKMKFQRAKEDDIQDIVQLSIIKAIKHQNSFKGTVQLKTWLLKIAINCYLDFIRLSSNKNEFTVEKESKIFDIQSVDSFEHEFLDECVADGIYKDIKSKIDKFSYYKTFLLYALYDLDYNEIAKIENISLNTVKTRIFRARKTLKHDYAYLEATNSADC
jgi:RNA polymerase sigma-70 factor (ECF subfamily)